MEGSFSTVLGTSVAGSPKDTTRRLMSLRSSWRSAVVCAVELTSVGVSNKMSSSLFDIFLSLLSVEIRKEQNVRSVALFY